MSSRHTRVLAAAMLCGLPLLWACQDDDRPTLQPTPVSPASPAPPEATPTPAPAPTAEPSPANKPPSVSVKATGSRSCHPSPRRPCTVEMFATATDPDDDRIAYGWDGCTQGNSPFAQCTVSAPGEFKAKVLVADGRGGFADASATAVGVNDAPVIRFGHPPDPATSNTTYVFAGGQPFDPDEDDEPNALCGRVTITATGPCRMGLSACGGVGDAFDTDVRTLAGPGTCVLEARVSDSWGAVGIHRYVFQVLP